MADGVDLRAASAARSFGSHAADRSGGTRAPPPSPHRLVYSLFDALGAADADRAADRPLRRPWWSMAAVCARPSLRPSQERQRVHARKRLAAGSEVAARRSAALRTLRDAEKRLEPRIAPGGGRGERRRRSARGLARLGCCVSGACSGPTRGRSLRRAARPQLGAPRLCGCSAARRYA